jgi:hypothetical protein
MVEHLLILKHNDLNNETEKSDRLIKNQSFNTDDDDSGTKSNENLLSVHESKRTLLSLNSPSIDSVNDPEGSISDNPIIEKVKKKKQRRPIERFVIEKEQRNFISLFRFLG